MMQVLITQPKKLIIINNNTTKNIHFDLSEDIDNNLKHEIETVSWT